MTENVNDSDMIIGFPELEQSQVPYYKDFIHYNRVRKVFRQVDKTGNRQLNSHKPLKASILQIFKPPNHRFEPFCAKEARAIALALIKNGRLSQSEEAILQTR
jgi:hypothetical protein